jgi:hypothetical protein
MAPRSAKLDEERLPVPASSPDALPPELAGLMAEDRGKGLSQSQEDNLVPLIYVLQALSPQVMTRNAEYIEGASPGDFWLRFAANPIHKGEEGIEVQPCFFAKDWIEWIPRSKGGGFVARHASRPADVVETSDSQNPNKVRLVRPNGNELVETRNHIVRVFTESGAVPYVLPFSSTGHSTSRQWMFMMNNRSGVPSFGRRYRLTTKERTNPLGTWFGVEVKDIGWVSVEDYAEGKKLYEAFASGAKRAEEPIVAAASRSTEDDEIPF